MTLFDRPVDTQTYAVVRYGLGFPATGAPLTPEGLLRRLHEPDRILQEFAGPGFDGTLVDVLELNAARKAVRAGEAGAEERLMAVQRQGRDSFFASVATDLARGVETDDPFRERLVRFWTNHFATRPISFHLRAGQPGYIDEAIRPNVAGRFADLLKAAVTHPVMLIFLDQVASVGPNSVLGQRHGRGLNENLARELMELHTLGVGASYAQADVTQMAELLTGLHYTVKRGARFNPLMAEPGAETVLGTDYGGGKADIADIHAVLEDLAVHPATAAHISRKLAAHFTADRPDPDLVAHMTAAYQRSGGDLAQVYAALLEHPAGWRDFGAKVKPPLDFVTSALRALGVRGADLAALAPDRVRKRLYRPMLLMGQPYNNPAGPDGFADVAEAWIQPQHLAARIAWAMAAARIPPGKPSDPRDFVATALGGAASGRLIWAAGAAETRVEGIGIVLASAEFNRR